MVNGALPTSCAAGMIGSARFSMATFPSTVKIHELLQLLNLSHHFFRRRRRLFTVIALVTSLDWIVMILCIELYQELIHTFILKTHLLISETNMALHNYVKSVEGAERNEK